MVFGGDGVRNQFFLTLSPLINPILSDMLCKLRALLSRKTPIEVLPEYELYKKFQIESYEPDPVFLAHATSSD